MSTEELSLSDWTVDKSVGAFLLLMINTGRPIAPLGRLSKPCGTSQWAPFLHGLCFRSSLELAQRQLYGKQTLSSPRRFWFYHLSQYLAAN